MRIPICKSKAAISDGSGQTRITVESSETEEVEEFKFTDIGTLNYGMD